MGIARRRVARERFHFRRVALFPSGTQRLIAFGEWLSRWLANWLLLTLGQRAKRGQQFRCFQQRSLRRLEWRLQ